MNIIELYDFLTLPPDSFRVISENNILKPEPTEAQKGQIWLQLKMQEEMFKQEKDTIFKTYK